MTAVAAVNIKRPAKKCADSVSLRKIAEKRTARAGLSMKMIEELTAVNLLIVSKNVTYPAPVTTKPR